jgi:hypothetical protein
MTRPLTKIIRFLIIKGAHLKLACRNHTPAVVAVLVQGYALSFKIAALVVGTIATPFAAHRIWAALKA